MSPSSASSRCSTSTTCGVVIGINEDLALYDRTPEVFSIADRDAVTNYRATGRIAESSIDAMDKMCLLDTNLRAVHP
jgi:hypothetical protein